VWGLKFFATRASNANAACEVFYEFDVRFHEVGGVKSTSMLFSSREGTSAANPDIVIFTMPTFRREVMMVGIPQMYILHLPLSPGRAVARDIFENSAMPNSLDVLWRVRAINGLGATSGWSEVRRHAAGPDLTK
jgi:hypothetical protein